MTKSILVPIDISAEKPSTPAIAMALDLAKLAKGKLTFLNVVEQFTGYTSAFLPQDFYEKSIANAKESLEEIASKHGVGDSVTVVVREGTPADEILRCANEMKADIIVMPSHDPGMADYFLGSVAGRVVRHAHCSVLVVRETK